MLPNREKGRITVLSPSMRVRGGNEIFVLLVACRENCRPAWGLGLANFVLSSAPADSRVNACVWAKEGSFRSERKRGSGPLTACVKKSFRKNISTRELKPTVTEEQESVVRIFFRNREGGEKKGRTEDPKFPVKCLY